MSLRQWSRDLAMGVRFAFAGGREGWVRALLTAVGVGLGVALLLLTTALPNALAVRHERGDARADITYGEPKVKKGDNSLLSAGVSTTFRDRDVRGREVEPEGPRAPLPPGVEKFPAAGEMVVSPALKSLLESDDGKLLRERLPDRIVGTIGESGLIGSHELAFYRGAEGLAAQGVDGARVTRIDHYGNPHPTESQSDPVLVLLVLVVFVVLLMPVAVFITAAVRFGGERRDRRLAALRLVGADGRSTRRIAAGEALAGAVLGLVLGAGFFLIGREVAGSVEVFGQSVFPSYLNPSPLLALLVAVAVPAAAVLVTLLALRGVVIEPLGVVRTAKPARRRLWWRLLLPLAGLGMLYPMVGQGRDGGDFNQYLVTGGVILLLVGVTALLPWIVETVVARLGAGAVSWQLAVRRLQLSSGTAARMVNGIAVAVAGAIALQMLFAGTDSAYAQSTGYDVSRAQMQVQVPEGGELADAAKALAATKGVEQAYAFQEGYVADGRGDEARWTRATVADCTSLREVAALPSCRDGDTFAVQGGDSDGEAGSAPVEAGRTFYFETSEDAEKSKLVAWTVPKGVKQARSVADPTGYKRGGVLITPSALGSTAVPGVLGQVYLRLDESVPDAREYVRNTAARINPLEEPTTWVSVERNDRYESIRTGLFVGAACVLALIGASLLVSQLEQLRERRKLLSALVAFGTRRRTLSLSVLWQTAIPISLGLLLASVVGLTLGAVLLRMTGTAVRVDWPSVLSMTGVGAGVVLVVTLLSLPPLLRLMRPDGLRTE
ncbi:ABC-type lipoprotein release transport system permease subunit [Streptomyces sp. SAI-208]|uniref:ABC transporter permease n=1 Tax=unclassified Streptomyces TaxID=2593676 RepID=UPI0024739BBB|nr:MULTISPECIES: FtsX-like permease family protein [unclassified Streptomyces]MDH6586992.1 ABC-type lipoprotein release transport system permease subunit [Streptomyces sp. SAI-133]MDH6607597.1 ABC-type lipoprotein release transport system permease subunit [Streptomyces sp. SAI-208]